MNTKLNQEAINGKLLEKKRQSRNQVYTSKHMHMRTPHEEVVKVKKDNIVRKITLQVRRIDSFRLIHYQQWKCGTPIKFEPHA